MTFISNDSTLLSDINSSCRTLRQSWEEFATQTEAEATLHKYVCCLWGRCINVPEIGDVLHGLLGTIFL